MCSLLEGATAALPYPVARGSGGATPGLPDNTAADHITALWDVLRQQPGCRCGDRLMARHQREEMLAHRQKSALLPHGMLAVASRWRMSRRTPGPS
ncbi:MAG: hypothetical protein M3460_17405 [Actinomycetota bacterium]|nr:hypothetical protein [Actinomycetota bacterium]